MTDSPHAPLDPTTAQRRDLQGLALRLLAAFLVTAMSAAIHAVSADVPLGQIIFWRSAVALGPILLYMRWRSPKGAGLGAGIRTRHPLLHLTRGLFGALAMALSFLSLTWLPVSQAMALAYLAPVLVLPLSAIVLKERIGGVLIAAVALGFGGVIALLWQALAEDHGTMGQGALIGIAAGLGYAVTMAALRVQTRGMARTERPDTIAFWFAVVAVVCGLLTWPFGWVPLTAEVTRWLVLAGVLGGCAHIASNEAIARTEISRLAPFDFTGLVWALLFDVVLFSVWPDGWGLLGAALITAAALLVTLRR